MNVSIRRDSPNRAVGDNQVASGIERESAEKAERRVYGGSAIARIAHFPVPCDRGHRAAGRNLEYLEAGFRCDEEISGGIDGQACRRDLGR